MQPMSRPLAEPSAEHINCTELDRLRQQALLGRPATSGEPESNRHPRGWRGGCPSLARLHDLVYLSESHRRRDCASSGAPSKGTSKILDTLVFSKNLFNRVLLFTFALVSINNCRRIGVASNDVTKCVSFVRRPRKPPREIGATVGRLRA